MIAGRNLAAAVVRFGLVLRRQGMPVTVLQTTDAARALDHLDLGDRHELYLGLRAVFVTRPEEQPIFDRCFDAFWRAEPPTGAAATMIADAPAAESPETTPDLTRGQSRRESLALEMWGDEDEDGAADPLRVPAASDREAVAGQDFSTFTPDQLEDVLKLTLQIARRLARRLTRRRRPARRRGRVDLRRTIRANLTRADLIDLRFRMRRRRKARLVLLCDVSGSMDLYSRFLLQFLFALQHVFGRVETFTFSTRLTRITDYLRAGSYRQVLRRLHEVRDWSGGTRIGASLAELNRDWPRLIDRRTIVIVLSDGWDTGDPDTLAAELTRIKRRAGRVIWLNPLLGNPAYEPLTRGMAAALPLVDHFAPAHNLAALRGLASKLSL